MAEDYYQILGVQRGASQSDIQDAYRGLARKYHPDLNPDDDDAKAKFQKVQQAYEVLNDPKKRDLYDRYGSSYESVGAGGPGGGPGGASWSFRTGPGGAEHIDLSELFGGGAGGGFGDFFSQFGGGGPRARERPTPRRGADLRHAITIPFTMAVEGGEYRLELSRSGGKRENITVKIPPGIDDGKNIRLRGQGESSPTGGPSGDILLKVNVAPHPAYGRQGKDLEVAVPVTVAEAALGKKVDVPTPQGTITLTVPPATSSGKRLRIKGHGVDDGKGPPGDLFAEIRIVLPEKLDEESRSLLENFDKLNDMNPRSRLRWHRP
jgi:DnaJ-class molecular chaperone